MPTLNQSEIFTAFREEENRHNKQSWIVGCVGFSAFGALIAGIYLPGPNWVFEALFLIGVIGAAILSAHFGSAPLCPICKKNTYCGVGAYCPVCGSDSGFLKPDLFHGSFRCTERGHNLSHRKGGAPSYRVAYCTYCRTRLKAGE
jgi:hypothetical protein